MDNSNQGTDPPEVLSDEEQLLTDNAELIESMRSKHDEIAIFQAPRGFEGIVILAAPTNPKSYQNFVNNLHNDKADKAVESENFALACIVHPDRKTAKSIFAKRPAFALKLVNRAQELAGSDTKELGKD